MGIDPGTNFMGYAIIRTEGRHKKPELVVSGVLDMNKINDPYIKLQRIFKRTLQVIDSYQPDELAIEAQFFGKNVQSMLKLGRAQGVAMTAALMRDVPIAEYEPRKIKMAITGNGAASKEQVKEMLRRILSISADSFLKELDATDALAAALCHFYETSRPVGRLRPPLLERLHRPQP